MRFNLVLLFFVLKTSIAAQIIDDDSLQLRDIYKTSLTNGKSYQWLDYLSNEIGGRLSGSLNAELAVEYTKSQLETLGLDRVWLQPVMVPKWVRGNPEFSYIEIAPGQTIPVNLCALGGSVATPPAGIKAKVVEVSSFDQLEALGRDKIKGIIYIYTLFKSYNTCLLYTSDAADEEDV